MALEMAEARDPHARVWGAAVVALYAAAAILAPGYLHPDEHFQTLEWARVALSGAPADGLTWEYAARIRPWLQPGLYAGVGLAVDPSTHPFGFALACRLLTALLGAAGVLLLATRYRAWFPRPDHLRLAWISTALFYPLPVLHARTSSEALGGALALAGLGLVTGRGRGLALGGLCLGLAIHARYQLGFLVIGLGAWQLLAARDRARVGPTLAGLTLGLGLGLVADRIGYGTWQLTPWRYLVENLVEGRAASFGTAPPWAYVGYLWHDLALPFSLVAILALPVAAARAPRHPLVWAALPFVLGHAAVGHKEPRFLFPYLFLLPPLAVLAFARDLDRLPPRLRRGGLVVLLALNLWWLGVGRHPTLRAGPWLEAWSAAGRPPLFFTGEDPFGRDDLHATLFAAGAEARPSHASDPQSGLHYVYDRRPGRAVEVPSGCELVGVWPWTWRHLPAAWLTNRTGQRLLWSRDRHALLRCD